MISEHGHSRSLLPVDGAHQKFDGAHKKVVPA